MEANVPQSNKPVTPTTQDVVLGQVAKQLKYPFDYETQRALEEFFGNRTQAYPLGSIFISTVDTDPQILLGYGTWVRYGNGRVIVGVDELDGDFEDPGNTGGGKVHQLTTAELARHNHGFTVITSSTPFNGGYGTGTNIAGSVDFEGGDQPHNNLQPYITAYMWNRTE